MGIKRSIYYVFLISLVVFLLIYTSQLLLNNVQYSPIEFVPPLPQSCSNQSIKAIWGYIFSVGSEDIKILNRTTLPDLCEKYLVMRINGNEFYLLSGKHSNSTTSLDAYYGKATPLYLDILKNITDVDSEEQFSFNEAPEPYLLTRNLSSKLEAIQGFNSVINMETEEDNWTSFFTSGPEYESYGFMSINELSSETNSIIIGEVSSNFSFGSMKFVEIKLPLNNSCIPNWTLMNNSCKDDETMLFYYEDTKRCNADIPLNLTNSTKNCDYNNDYIIGNKNSLKTSLELEVYINSSPLNNSHKYNNTQKVELKEENITRVEFEYEFKEPLNLKDISIDRQSAGAKIGYIIVDGINRTKKVRVDKLNSSSSKVCISEETIEDISELTLNCSGDSEILLNCPGQNNKHKCSIENNIFIVENLSRSAVKEILSSPSTSTANTTNTANTTCIVNWACTNWGSCISNVRTRTCSDLNNCNTIDSHPSLSEQCVSQPTCSPNWNCSSWAPSNCPKEKEQRRTCSDLNNCGTVQGKPLENQPCIFKESSLAWTIVIVIIVLMIIAVITIIAIVLTRRSDNAVDLKSPYNNNNNLPSSYSRKIV